MKITRHLLTAMTCIVAAGWAQTSVNNAESLRNAAKETGGVIELTANIDITDAVQGVAGTSASSSGLYIAENTTLNLNGKTLSIDLPDEIGRNANCIKIASGKTLTIEGTGTLTVINHSTVTLVGFSGGINTTDAALIINGGTINATGGRGGAGIGGGQNSNGTNSAITINGGTVTATGGKNAAGIGGGGAASASAGTGQGGNININGGNITAIAGEPEFTPRNAQAIGRGNNAQDVGTTVNVTGLYNYRTNTENTAPSGASTSGSFTNSPDYKYVELVPFTPSEDYSIYISAVTNERAPLNYTLAYSIGVTVENTGTNATGNLSIALSGSNASKFNLSSASISNIAVGGKTTFSIAPKETGLPIGTYPVTVTITGGNGILASYNMNFRVLYILSGNFTMTSDISIADTTWGTNLSTSAAGLYIAENATLNLNGKTLSIEIANSANKSSMAANGIKIASGKTLTIEGTGTLTVINNSDYLNGPAGFGAGINSTDGTLIINGGTINATGGLHGAAIGGGHQNSGGNITINGGTVTATGGSSGAGIGGGYQSSGGGGNITINGGTVTATSHANGAGIGGGANCAGGNITITGGTIRATGANYAAGIGGGSSSVGGTITITGGNIIARTNATSASNTSQAIGRGSTSLTTTVFNITGTYEYRTNTVNSEPAETPTSGEFALSANHTYKWIELVGDNGNTPILFNPSVTYNLAPATYYTINGKPLGAQKPKIPGVYLEKSGKHVRKIAVK